MAVARVGIVYGEAILSAAGGHSRLALQRTRCLALPPAALASSTVRSEWRCQVRRRLSKIGNARTSLGVSGAARASRQWKPAAPHHLGIGVAAGLALWQTRILDALAIALIPRQGGEPLPPGWRRGGHGVEGGPEGFRDQFEPMQHAHGGEHRRRVGALLPTSFQPAQNTAGLEQLSEQEVFRAAGEEAIAACAEHGKVKARRRQREPKQVLPVDTSPHRRGRGAWRDGHGTAEWSRAPARGREARLTIQRETGGKGVVLEHCPTGIPQGAGKDCLWEGGMGHTDGCFRHRLQGVRA